MDGTAIGGGSSGRESVRRHDIIPEHSPTVGTSIEHGRVERVDGKSPDVDTGETNVHCSPGRATVHRPEDPKRGTGVQGARRVRVH